MTPGISVPANYGRAIERWPGAQSLSNYHQAIVSASNGLNHGLVEHVKSFVESVCLTVLSELNEQVPSSTPSTTELLIEALKACGIHNTKDATSLNKVFSAFNKMADALSEMRNETGPVAHGKDGFFDAICTNHARAFLHVGDALVGVLLGALEGTEPDLTVTRQPYSRFGHLSKKVDQVVSMNAKVETDEAGPILVVSMNVAGKKEEAVKMRIEPSRLLFALDREAFVEVLKEVPPDLRVVEEAAETVVRERAAPELKEISKAVTKVESAPQVAPLPHDGELMALIPPLVGFLTTEHDIVDPNRVAKTLLEAAEQNMGVDWQHRESLQAGMRLAFRRTLTSFDVDAQKAWRLAEELVGWLIDRIAE